MCDILMLSTQDCFVTAGLFEQYSERHMVCLLKKKNQVLKGQGSIAYTPELGFRRGASGDFIDAIAYRGQVLSCFLHHLRALHLLSLALQDSKLLHIDDCGVTQQLLRSAEQKHLSACI